MVKSETNALILATFSQIKQPLQHYKTLHFYKIEKLFEIFIGEILHR